MVQFHYVRNYTEHISGFSNTARDLIITIGLNDIGLR